MTISEKLIASCIFMVAMCLLSIKDVTLNVLAATFLVSYGAIAVGCDLRKAHDSWREQRDLKKENSELFDKIVTLEHLSGFTTEQSKALVRLAEEVRHYYESDVDMVGDFSSDLYKAYEAYKKAIGERKDQEFQEKETAE